jgi:hypothetical protein
MPFDPNDPGAWPPGLLQNVADQPTPLGPAGNPAGAGNPMQQMYEDFARRSGRPEWFGGQDWQGPMRMSPGRLGSPANEAATASPYQLAGDVTPLRPGSPIAPPGSYGGGEMDGIMQMLRGSGRSGDFWLQQSRPDYPMPSDAPRNFNPANQALLQQMMRQYLG